MMFIRCLLASLLLFTTACDGSAGRRAVTDARVGSWEGDGLRVQSGDGLAIVQRRDGDTLHLWQQAPVVELTVSNLGSQARAVELACHNAMPGSVGSIAGGPAVNPAQGPIPTWLTWTLSLEPGQSTTLTVAPADWQADTDFSVAMLADVQRALPDLGEIFDVMATKGHLRFVLGGGDLTSGGEVEELETFQKTIEDHLPVPFYTTLGNHEVFWSKVPYFDIFGRANVHFRFHQVAFTLVDDANGTLVPAVRRWLGARMREAEDSVHVVTMHIPIIDPSGVRGGGFASRHEAAALLDAMRKRKVDLTLYGHVHSFYEFDNAGIPAYISGGGGAIPERFDGTGRHFLDIRLGPGGVKSVDLVEVD